MRLWDTETGEHEEYTHDADPNRRIQSLGWGPPRVPIASCSAQMERRLLVGVRDATVQIVGCQHGRTEAGPSPGIRVVSQ